MKSIESSIMNRLKKELRFDQRLLWRIRLIGQDKRFHTGINDNMFFGFLELYDHYVDIDAELDT